MPRIRGAISDVIERVDAAIQQDVEAAVEQHQADAKLPLNRWRKQQRAAEDADKRDVVTELDEPQPTATIQNAKISSR